MRDRISSVLIVLAGIINLIPVIGILSAAQVSSMYEIEVTDPTVELLMRHRAVLFGLLGSFMIASAFKPAWQTLAIWAGLISMLAFIVLSFDVTVASQAITRVVYADIAGIILLLAAIFLRLKLR